MVQAWGGNTWISSVVGRGGKGGGEGIYMGGGLDDLLYELPAPTMCLTSKFLIRCHLCRSCTRGPPRHYIHLLADNACVTVCSGARGARCEVNMQC